MSSRNPTLGKFERAVIAIILAASLIGFCYFWKLKSRYSEVLISIPTGLPRGSLQIGARKVALPSTQSTFYFERGRLQYRIVVGSFEESGIIQLDSEAYLHVKSRPPLLEGDSAIQRAAN